MGSVLAIINKATFGKLRTREDQTPAIGTQIAIDRYESEHPTLDTLKVGGSLYLVTVRPDEVLWLAAVLAAPARRGHGWHRYNVTPVVDITALCKEIGIERGGGKLATRLEAPRALNQRAAAILKHVADESFAAWKLDKPYVLSIPQEILSLPPVPAPGPEPKPKPVLGGKLPPLAHSLGTPCLAQIDLVIEELRKNPKAFLDRKAATRPGTRGPFTETLQTVLAGTIDAAEVTRLFDKVLFPWVTDATRAAMTKATGDLDAYFGELVDEVAIRAIDDLCAGMVGYAIDRLDRIPDACSWQHDPLQHYAKHVKSLLRPAKSTTPANKPAAKPKRTTTAKKPLAKGAFAFVNARSLDGDAVVAETPIHQAQFIEAMAMYAGIRKRTAAATLDAYVKAQGMFNRSEFQIELWDVIEGGRAKPRFEYWVQGAGDGMIFNYGTDESPNSIGSTQHRFESHGSDQAESEALVAALQTAASRDL
jgi:hypothetical protein